MSERYVTPVPLPTPYEREVLECLIEECAEVIQRATKMLRFGRDEQQMGQFFSNKTRLSFEAGDLSETIDLAIEAGLIDPKELLEQKPRKREKLLKFMQESR